MTYRVFTPSGVLADGEWSDPRDIPARIPDRWENYFDTEEAEVEVENDDGVRRRKWRWEL